MSDLFQDGVPAEFIARVWTVMGKAHQHTFQILTKRPENMLAILRGPDFPILPNVWLGTSVESAKYCSRIATLRQVPAAVRFISFEPLLASVGKVALAGVHWAIVGGESGPKARPMEEKWVDAIARQCAAQQVAFFFKQWGGVNKKAAGRIYDGRTWDDYPNAATMSAAP
jgi:protein gp37